MRRGGSKTQLIGWSLYTLLLWLLKLCMCIFYSRLTLVSFFHLCPFGLEKTLHLIYLLTA